MGFTSLRSRLFRDGWVSLRRKTVRPPTGKPRTALESLETRRLLAADGNSPPQFDYYDQQLFLDEGMTFLFTGSFSDADVSDNSHQLVVDWGDGTQSIALPGADWQWPVISGTINSDNGHAYYLLDRMSWSEAESYGQSLGGHLASINDQAEQDWLWNTFGHNEWGGTEPLWIGLTDSDDYSTESNFVWASGETVDYTNWNAGEPNNLGDEDFGMLTPNDGKWNDLYFAWNRGVVETDAPANFPPSGDGSHFFQLTHRYPDNLPDGAPYAITATVTDQAGDSAEVTADAYVQDVAPFVYVDWVFGQEGSNTNVNAWLNDPGDDAWTVTVDYGDGTDPVTLHPDQAGYLGLQHVYNDDGFYQVYATVLDEESGAVYESYGQVDISNLNPTLNNIAVAPGAVDDGQAVTLSGIVGDPGADDELVLTVDWGDGQQSVLHPEAGAPHPFSADHAYSADGTYNIFVVVEDGDGGYVYRDGSGQMPENAVQWDAASGGNGHWYASIETPSSFHNANLMAEEMGGHLVTITSAEENQFLVDTILYGPEGYGDGLFYAYWMGLTDEAVNGDFRWTTGEPYDYANWNPTTQEPNDYWGPASENYAVFNWHYANNWFGTEPGVWNDMNEWGQGGASVWHAIVEFEQAPAPFTVSVGPVGPTVSMGQDAAVDEGAAFAASGSFADPGADAWTATVDYGDGSGVKPLTLKADKTFDLNHVYGDNGTYTVMVTVTDTQDGLSHSDSLLVTVNNVPPVVSVGGPGNGVRGQARHFSALVGDAGALDTYSATWSVRGPDGAVLASGTGTSLEFTPAVAGAYAASFTVTDDDGASTTASKTLNVCVVNVQADPANPSQDLLAVGGNTGKEQIALRPGLVAGSVEVFINDVSQGTFAAVKRVVVFGQAGDDQLLVHNELSVPVTFYGGDGDDSLMTNHFSDVLIGGAGDDWVIGRGGRTRAD